MTTTARGVLVAGISALVGLSACSDGGRLSGLDVSVRSAATAGTATAAGLSVPEGVTISRIRMAVRRVKVEGGDATAACDPSPVTSALRIGAMHDGGSGGSGGSGRSSDDGLPDDGAQHGEDGECELSFGPFDVELAGSALSGGGVTHAFTAPIPIGTYREVAIKIATVPAARAAGNPVLTDLAAAHASILVDGFVQDAGTTTTHPFTFSTPMEVQQKREGAITITPTSNVTLTFDPSGWFLSGGSRLDPADPVNQGAILANIRASLRLVHDDDHDGHDDDDGPGHR